MTTPPITRESTNLDQLAVNTIRTLSIDMVQKANSGHPGLPLGAAPMAYTLWTRYLRHNPANPRWINRDRFILSAGHGSALLYSLLHLTGYNLPLEEVKKFRQYESMTPGHPEYHHTDGVETTTGPLGQGFANGVGMAMAEAFLAATFNRGEHQVIDHYTYVLASDGDLMEGVASEAASLAGHLKLGKLIVLYDDNKVMLSANTDVAFTEDVSMRFKSYGWHVVSVPDGNNLESIAAAIEESTGVTDQPSLIAVRTVIGYGSPNRQGTHKAHGEPLGADELKLTKQSLGWPSDEPFYIPGEALEHFRQALEDGAQYEESWNGIYQRWAEANPDLAKIWGPAFSGELPEGWDTELKLLQYGTDTKPVATRDTNGVALNAIARFIPTMIGGDADLSSSTKTLISGAPTFLPSNYSGRNIAYGVREHAMGAITNGLELHGGILKPYTATFFTFSDYMRPPMRLSALMDLDTIFVFTHDSIGVGEDGPTHEPIEQLAAMRAIPNMVVFRPADANETVAAWRAAMLHQGPVSLVFSRQKLPVFAPDGVAEGVARGGYIKADSEGTPQVILLSSGSEVSLAMAAYETLKGEGIAARVVSIPSWELFRKQDDSYKESVLPNGIRKRVAIEAGSPLGWREWVGLDGIVIGLERYGASAPYEVVYENLGITAKAVVESVHALLK